MLAAIDAVTVPFVVMPLTAALKVVPLFGATSVNDTVFVPPAVPATVTSDAVKVETSIASLNTTVKSIGLVFVGSACPTPWFTVTVGATLSTAYT